MADEKVDVFISGAGPVGLLLNYQLRRLGLTTHIVDSADKASPAFPMYGRACTLYPRTLELLDQLDLYADMAQVGLVARRRVIRDSTTGEPVHGRDWGRQVDQLAGSTFFAFMLNIRLKYSEDILRRRCAEVGSRVQAPVNLVDFALCEDPCADEWRVTATCSKVGGEMYCVKAKYIVGCDGGSSAVRRLAGIPFVGEDQEDHWVRIDGIVRTNMPDSRIGFAAFESKTHGNVLWAALDHGATRIGYVLSSEMFAKYGRHMSKEDAMQEAKAAVAPFELEWERVDWHTVYGVKQHVAARLQDRERILLAGDAAHTHSSGSAQGMNTGTHDAVSLGWRLAGVGKGWYKPEVLATYTTERHAVAEALIANDRTIAALTSQHKPSALKHRLEEPHVLLAEFMRTIASFNNGLGISYPPNLVNDVAGSRPSSMVPGDRAPDVLVWRNGLPQFPVRLYEITKNNGKFHVVVFTGDVHTTRNLLRGLRSEVDKLAPQFKHAVSFRTIILGFGIAFEEHLGVEPFGDAYWDIDHSAHLRYQVSTESGVVVILRPDGILGFVAPLDCFDHVADYFGRLVVSRKLESVMDNRANGHVGELINLDENNLDYLQAREQARERGHPENAESGLVFGR